jgi:hypothetical protein
VLPDRCTRAACSCDLSRLVRGVGEDGGEDESEQESCVNVRRRAMNPDTGEESLLDKERGECGEASNTEIGVGSDSNEAVDILEGEDEAEAETVEMYDKRDDADIEAGGEL